MKRTWTDKWRLMQIVSESQREVEATYLITEGWRESVVVSSLKCLQHSISYGMFMIMPNAQFTWRRRRKTAMVILGIAVVQKGIDPHLEPYEFFSYGVRNSHTLSHRCSATDFVNQDKRVLGRKS